MASFSAIIAYLVYMNYISYSNSVTIWQLDFTQYCSDDSWSCFNSDPESNQLLLNDSNPECGYQYCAKYTKEDYTKIHDIRTLDQMNLTFEYTLAVLDLNTATEIFSIDFITDTETINIAQYNSNNLFNKTNFTVKLDEKLWNQSSITLNFSMSASGSGDLAYLYEAIIYSDTPNSPTTGPNNDKDSISWGTEYEDKHMLIVAASFLMGAVLIVIYFRCCKRRWDLMKSRKEKAVKQSIESTTKDVESKDETDKLTKRSPTFTSENETNQ
mmetsp:Transcript_76895/g.68901  ORF Transcript_76895/g.68901 Transcript_76895/m.68901 type:complete len:270 (+) Transcript_76895:20-829(+)|eukprot:CAMPEP_0201586136 /NCGR_PEP_ID=MMETSP0190_2-20130828/129493_1 /ASSEMBLY_ACC=CAM_ASM_000263 /TAXON_ID=37353 /ORGANISM="Rosalina sp." /LENGTH=269 /DNA_ID=CAMNT_0048033511 /DNA_START=10 /DNA_END=819 /DNA_ORIENTATION=+